MFLPTAGGGAKPSMHVEAVCSHAPACPPCPCHTHVPRAVSASVAAPAPQQSSCTSRTVAESGDNSSRGCNSSELCKYKEAYLIANLKQSRHIFFVLIVKQHGKQHLYE
jgi:hypothetical protein